MIVKREARKNMNARQMAWEGSATNPWEIRTVGWLLKNLLKEEKSNLMGLDKERAEISRH